MSGTTSLLNDFANINQTLDPNVGSAVGRSNSVATLVTTTVPSLCIALAVVAFVTASRKWLSSIYAPKFVTKINPLSWMVDVCRARDVDLLTDRSPDMYLLLRYLKFCILLCVGGCVMVCPLLLPLNATGNGGMEGLNMLTIANHGFFGWVMYLIACESIFYCRLRNTIRGRKALSSGAEARTVLYTDIAEEHRTVEKVKQAIGGGEGLEVRLVTDTKSLRKALRRRKSALDRIDTLLTRLTKHLAGDNDELGSDLAETCPDRKERHTVGHQPKVLWGSTDFQYKSLARHAFDIRQLQIDRKQHLHRLMCVGKPDDGHLLARLAQCDPPRVLPCAFVRFRSALEAEIAFRRFGSVVSMTPRCVDASVHDIIWENLDLGLWMRLSRRTLSQLFILAIIVFWSFPVAFATAIINIDTLLPGIRWQETLPPVAQNVLKGFVPSVLVSILMSLPPKIIARAGRFSGHVTRGEVESQLHRYYFGFRVVQIFLVAALGSTASSVIVQIYSDPSSTTTILAKKLPGASNFYFSYLTVQGLSESAFILLNIGGLLSRSLLGQLFDDTQRKDIRRKKGCFEVSVGTACATTSSLLVIALCYAPTAPLILFFATFAFSMFYLAHRHNWLFSAVVTADTGGEIHATALQNAMVGVYIGELFLIGILTINSVDSRRVSGPLILSFALLLGTILYQKLLRDTLRPWKTSFSSQDYDDSPDGGYDKEGPRRARPQPFSSRLIGIFLDDFTIVRAVLKTERDSSSEERPCDGMEYLAPGITEKDSDIVLSRKLTCIAPESADSTFLKIFGIRAGEERQSFCVSTGGSFLIVDCKLPVMQGKQERSLFLH
ncbi:hypothetical protein Q7P37_010281 [Cladosporium fusiforme]